MRVSISPPRVQLAFGRGNLTWPQVSYPWLAIGGLPGRAATEDIRDVCAKSCVFIDWPRRRDGDRCGGGADGGRAVAGSWPAPRPQAKALQWRPRGPAAPPTSAPADVITVVAEVRQQPALLPRSSAPGLRSPRPRTAGPIMTIIMAAARSTTAAARPITVAARIITAVCRQCIERAYVHGHPTPAGSRKFP